MIAKSKTPMFIAMAMPVKTSILMAMTAQSETPVPTAMAMPVRGFNTTTKHSYDQQLPRVKSHSYGYDCQEWNSIPTAMAMPVKSKKQTKTPMAMTAKSKNPIPSAKSKKQTILMAMSTKSKTPIPSAKSKNKTKTHSYGHDCQE